MAEIDRSRNAFSGLRSDPQGPCKLGGRSLPRTVSLSVGPKECRTSDMIKSPLTVCVALLFLPAGLPGQEKYPAGIVHGPKAGFNIAAPDGWVVDTESGKHQDLPCVLYPKDSSWTDAKTVIYSKVASAIWECVHVS